MKQNFLDFDSKVVETQPTPRSARCRKSIFKDVIAYQNMIDHIESPKKRKKKLRPKSDVEREFKLYRCDSFRKLLPDYFPTTTKKPEKTFNRICDFSRTQESWMSSSLRKNRVVSQLLNCKASKEQRQQREENIKNFIKQNKPQFQKTYSTMFHKRK